MEVEQVHVKHKTWHTIVTVGEGDDTKKFGLKNLGGGKFRVINGSVTTDFDSRDEALAHCESHQ